MNVLSPPVSRDLVVVGAGIVGASVAYHAARAGATVTLVDAGRPGAGVTADSFAWVGASGVRTGPAAGLRVTAAEEYRRLVAELPGLPVTWSGSLSWGAAGGAPAAGPGQEIVDAATVATLEPTPGQPPEWAIWAPGDGAADPVGVTERLVAGARARGARIQQDTPVTAVRPVWSAPWSTTGTSISGRPPRTGYTPLPTRPNGLSLLSGPHSAAPRTSSCSAPGSAYAPCLPTARRSSARSPRCPASTWR